MRRRDHEETRDISLLFLVRVSFGCFELLPAVLLLPVLSYAEREVLTISICTGRRLADDDIVKLAKALVSNSTLKMLNLTSAWVTAANSAEFGVDHCLWSGGIFDTVLSECYRRQPDWRCGCTSTG
jgi:hypothetical protein